MYKNIINPKNGKLVDINSTLGKKILKKYLNLLLEHYIGGSGPRGIRRAFDEDNDETYQFNHYNTIDEADNEDLIGKVIELGELPADAWFTYADGIIYKVIEYNGKIDKMICKKLGEDILYELDPFLVPVKYWGDMQNVPAIFKSGEEIRLGEDDEPFDFFKEADSESLRENIGKELNIGELPLKSWISYKNKLLQILHYDNFGKLHPITGNKGMYCYKYGTNPDLLERIDPTDDATYWGPINNVPSELKEP